MGKRQANFQLQYDPADIPKLAMSYMAVSAAEDREMEDAGVRILNGDFRRSNLETICAWKSKRRFRLLESNTDADIERSLRSAIDAVNVRDAVNALTPLKGVGVKMASAILTAIKPTHYTVLDFRALEALGVEDSNELELYALYVEACRDMSVKYGVDMRTFDRANWQWSKCKAVCGPKPWQRCAE